jgi:hypothetical protein
LTVPESEETHVWLFRVGIALFRLISGAITPPFVSMPSVSGLTSMT